MAAVFISYRRHDAAGYAGRLREALERRLGPGQIFRDVDTLSPGQDFVAAIEGRLRDCAVFIALIGREWLDALDAAGRRRLDDPADYVRMEIAAALQRPGVLVVPVLVEGATMPSAKDLPDSLRTLARRHAITLDDETWDTDMDRLASAIAKACGEGERVALVPRRRMLDRRLAIGGALLALALVAWIVIPGNETNTEGDVARDAATTYAVSSTAASPGQAQATEGSGPAMAIDIPRIAEVAHGDVIYTLLSGSTVRQGNRSTLRLRFRVANDGRYPANLWDDSFRLAIGDQLLSPTSGLNEVVGGQTITPAIVTFDIPASAEAARLRITLIGQTAELPLDLSATGRQASDERGAPGEASSAALVSTPMRETRLLLSHNDIDVTLLRVTTRRFVNKLRVIVSTRVANRGRYPISSGSVTLRLAAGDDLHAPVNTPSDVVNSNANAAADFVFEIPPATSKVVLRGIADGSTTEVPLAVQTDAGP